ncbi:MAG: HNH endonuclease [Desulfosporosinus sp.]|nr:HNH endonuclease [Desulfosporosinus sp.]
MVINELKTPYRTIKTIRIKGEYSLNDKEYIINFPYDIRLNIESNTAKVKILDKIAKGLILAIKNQSFENRIKFLNPEIIEIDSSTFILYKYNALIDYFLKLERGTKDVKVTRDVKRAEYRETNQMLMNYYYTEKAKQEQEQEPKKTESRKNKRLVRKSIKDNVKTYNISFNNETDYVNLTSVNIHPLSNVQSELYVPRINNENENSVTRDSKDTISKRNNHDNTNEVYTLDFLTNKKGSLEPEKKLRSFIATSRNLSIVKFLKNLYEDKCQICGERIEISPGSFLSEVHHIKPLGVHNGPDVVENAIVLCPNHHAMFDRGAITIDIDKKIVIHFNPDNPLNNKHIELKHNINGSYIAFHNQNIFINPVDHNQKNMIFVKDEIATSIQAVDFGNIVTLQDMDTSELFDIKLEDKFNRDFMKPIEKVILQKRLNDIVRHDAFRYKVISIRSV